MNDNQPLTLPDNDDHSRSLDDLQNQDIHALVSTFVQSNARQPLVGTVVSLLDSISSKADLQSLINQLLSTLTDPQFYNGLFNALKAHIEANPWSTAFLIIGIVLLCSNPRAGFGSLGPIADSLAAAWQLSRGGTVAASSAFMILQSWGKMYAVSNDAWVIANAGGREVGRWSRGEYGDPVTHWWNGVYGDPVARWWKGEYGSPVAEWANSVTKK